jgi:hypothetical protein
MAAVQHLKRIDWEAAVRVIGGFTAGSALLVLLG